MCVSAFWIKLLEDPNVVPFLGVSETLGQKRVISSTTLINIRTRIGQSWLTTSRSLLRQTDDPAITLRDSIPTTKPGVALRLALDLFDPERFGLLNRNPTKESDLHTCVMATYQVLILASNRAWSSLTLSVSSLGSHRSFTVSGFSATHHHHRRGRRQEPAQTVLITLGSADAPEGIPYYHL